MNCHRFCLESADRSAPAKELIGDDLLHRLARIQELQATITQLLV